MGYFLSPRPERHPESGDEVWINVDMQAAFYQIQAICSRFFRTISPLFSLIHRIVTFLGSERCAGKLEF